MAYRDDFQTLNRLRAPGGLARFYMAIEAEMLETLRREAVSRNTTVSALIRASVQAKFAGAKRAGQNGQKAA